ncbi:MAG: hypothetical protein MJ217_00340 [Bacilli bacterium]|nr:hypothetical protein [Bacilli bacterium]
MQIENYLKLHQPIIYRTFVNSLQTNRLSHAYLLSGNPGTPLLDIAKYLAKSVLCDDPSPLACNSCITCLRVDDENYPDYFLFDGSKSTIDKGSVLEIQNAFDKKAFEAKGIRVYILHLIENMTVEAINTILKFLEEPGAEIYAFLTTNNDSAILPTIISRCQVLNVKLIEREEVIKEAISFNVPQEDAELLSYFYNSGELIHDVLEDKEINETYLQAKGWFGGLMNAFLEKNPAKAVYFAEKEINPKIKSKESMRLFIDFLIELFEDLLNIQNRCSFYLKSYDKILSELASNMPHVKETLIELLKNRSLINSNVSTALLCDHIMNYIVKEV